MKKNYFTLLLLTFLFITKAQVNYNGKPMYNIDVKRGGVFLGSIQIELFPTIAYHHVRNFDSLVSVQFYDTTAFHRVIPGFMIQGGDPNSRHGTTSTWGTGQAGQPTVNAEFSAMKHVRGVLSAARSTNINSATSQFFICVAAYPSLNGQYSAYGQVISGMNFVDSIVLAPRNANDLPNVKHEMYITAIGINTTIPTAPILGVPANDSTGVSINTALQLKWSLVPDAVTYKVEVSDDPGFVFIVKTLQTANNSVYINGGLLPETKYYWRIKSNNGGHWSAWSNAKVFETLKINTVALKELESDLLSVKVFPNPSLGKFTFTNLVKESRIEIYNLEGKRIFEMDVNEEQEEINLEGREKGVYTYKIFSGATELTQGKVILK